MMRNDKFKLYFTGFRPSLAPKIVDTLHRSQIVGCILSRNVELVKHSICVGLKLLDISKHVYLEAAHRSLVLSRMLFHSKPIATRDALLLICTLHSMLKSEHPVIDVLVNFADSWIWLIHMSLLHRTVLASLLCLGQPLQVHDSLLHNLGLTSEACAHPMCIFLLLLGSRLAVEASDLRPILCLIFHLLYRG